MRTMTPGEGRPQTATLTNWLEVNGFLLGNVSGHPNHKDGSFVRTSRLSKTHESVLNEGGMAYTQNTTYLLGKRCGNV